MIKTETKFVLLDRSVEGVNCDMGLVDNATGAYKAVKNLIDHGTGKLE